MADVKAMEFPELAARALEAVDRVEKDVASGDGPPLRELLERSMAMYAREKEVEGWLDTAHGRVPVDHCEVNIVANVGGSRVGHSAQFSIERALASGLEVVVEFLRKTFREKLMQGRANETERRAAEGLCASVGCDKRATLRLFAFLADEKNDQPPLQFDFELGACERHGTHEQALTILQQYFADPGYANALMSAHERGAFSMEKSDARWLPIQ